MSKEGTFDWIIDYSGLKVFLHPSYTRLEEQISNQVVLVIGSGTSPLSSLMADDGYKEVLSLDNDLSCIEHMRRVYDSKPTLSWLHYDLITHDGEDLDAINEIKRSRVDLVVDKGTLDAILVEGCSCEMLADVYQMLKPGGVYVVCSIHNQALLRKLLQMESLGYTCHFYEISESVGSHASASASACASSDDRLFEFRTTSTTCGIVAICTKSLDDVTLDFAALAQEELRVIDEYFQHDNPLLTADFAVQLQIRFQDALEDYAYGSGEGKSQSRSLPISVVHSFLQEQEREYTFDLFMEDFEGFVTESPGQMTIEEVLDFLRSKQ